MNLPARTRITCPSDLLALVPTALGFHPDDSLVLVVTAGEVGCLHVRVDLPADAQEAVETAECLLEAVARAGARQVALVAYSDDERLCEDLVGSLLEQLGRVGVEVVCALRADDRRWFSLDPRSGCGPADGTPYDLSAHPITAQAVLDGRVVFDSRRALADSLVGEDVEAVEAVQEAADEAVRRLRAAARQGPADDAEAAWRHLMAEGSWVRDRVRRYVRAGEPLDDAEVGRLVVAIMNVDVRDVAWAEMTRADASAHVELWRDVVCRTSLELLAAPAALLAFAAWLAGDGALAWCALERCQAAEPDYSMGALVSQALVAALPPSVWQPIPSDALPLFAG